MSDDTHFRKFAVTLENEIHRYGDIDDFNKHQKRQIRQLIRLEDELRATLVKQHMVGDKMYRAFVKYICDDKNNILAARPFFRERQKVFTKHISPALKKRDIDKLKKFRFNFTFVQFILGSHDWRPNAKVVRLAKQISAIRWDLVTLNLPLAISRARIFFSRTPRSHLEYMDLVDIACEGLMNAVDKYVPSKNAGAFPSVAIQRMTGNFIEAYSETEIHFYPVDKRKLYRANKLLGRGGEADISKLVDKVNDGVESTGRTNAEELTGLLAAQSCVSADVQVQEGEEKVRVEERFQAPTESQPDTICEDMDGMRTMVQAIAQLSLLEQKILRLRGVSF